MVSIASHLKAEREKRKISLSQISADTHISIYHLENLEEGRFDHLPGGMYNRAFLKAYCESLDLDLQELMRRFENEIATVSEKPQKIQISTTKHNPSIQLSPIFIWSLMLMISATGIFLSRSWLKKVFSPYFSHQSITYQGIKLVQPEVVNLTENSRAEPQLGTISTAPPASSTTPISSQVLQLEIDATAECWISVHRDGNPSISKLFVPGEIQSFNAVEQFLVIIGNAGGVNLKINGKPTKPLGKSGEVVKILINEKNLQNLLGQAAG
jgi:cytoskeleton protein RodZ